MSARRLDVVFSCLRCGQFTAHSITDGLALYVFEKVESADGQVEATV